MSLVSLILIRTPLHVLILVTSWMTPSLILRLTRFILQTYDRSGQTWAKKDGSSENSTDHDNAGKLTDHPQ